MARPRRVPLAPGSTGIETSTVDPPNEKERNQFNQKMHDAGVLDRQNSDNTPQELIFLHLYGTSNPTPRERAAESNYNIAPLQGLKSALPPRS